MIINRDILRREIVGLMRSIDRQIEYVETEARRKNTSPERLRDEHGNWVLNPLLLAKVQAINSLVILDYSNEKK